MSIQKRVEKIVFEEFYGGPLSGSTERLAKALVREFGLSEDTNTLLRSAKERPTRCYCPPEKCEAPVIMGRQTSCLRTK